MSILIIPIFLGKFNDKERVNTLRKTSRIAPRVENDRRKNKSDQRPRRFIADRFDNIPGFIEHLDFCATRTSRAIRNRRFYELSDELLLASGILKAYRIFGAPPPLIVVCCVVVGCVNVASRAVVVLVVGSDEHEAKLSIAAIPSGKINIFIGEFSLLRVRCQMRHTDVFVRTFFPVRRQISVARF